MTMFLVMQDDATTLSVLPDVGGFIDVGSMVVQAPPLVLFDKDAALTVGALQPAYTMLPLVFQVIIRNGPTNLPPKLLEDIPTPPTGTITPTSLALDIFAGDFSTPPGPVGSVLLGAFTALSPDEQTTHVSYTYGQQLSATLAKGASNSSISGQLSWQVQTTPADYSRDIGIFVQPESSVTGFPAFHLGMVKYWGFTGLTTDFRVSGAMELQLANEWLLTSPQLFVLVTVTFGTDVYVPLGTFKLALSVQVPIGAAVLYPQPVQGHFEQLP